MHITWIVFKIFKILMWYIFLGHPVFVVPQIYFDFFVFLSRKRSTFIIVQQ